MDLKITVGILTRIKNKGDYQGFKYLQSVFSAINQALANEELPTYREPANLKRTWSVKLKCSYIHYLRRLAAHISLRNSLPEPSLDDPAADPCYREYLETMGLTAMKWRFDHLFFHSDCNGFYLPVDFEDVLFPELGLNIPGDMVGSSYRLRDECHRISERLALPLDLRLTPEEFQDGPMRNNSDHLWKKFPVESYVCFILYWASIISIATGAAIVFTHITEQNLREFKSGG